MQSNDALAGQYVALSQACLEAGDPLSNTNVTVVDTLLLHIRYYTMCDDYSGHPAPTGLWSNSAARAWTTLGVTMKLAIAIGLHREPSLWGLPPNEVTRRRRTMVRSFMQAFKKWNADLIVITVGTHQSRSMDCSY